MSEKNMKFKLTFDAIVVEKLGAEFKIVKRKSTIHDFNDNEVIIKIHYSSLNYKDVLLTNGNLGLVRRYPHIPGIDLAGVVEFSNSNKFNVGDQVIVVANPLGVKIQGGLAKFAKVPDCWVEILPRGITLKEAIIFGTAGFTASLCIHSFEKFNSCSKKTKLLVNGATGGVGLLSVYLLVNKGYEVTALTSKADKKDLLYKLGVNDVIVNNPGKIQSQFPLSKQRYSGIIETVGIKDIGFLTGQLFDGGVITIIGMVTSNKLEISVLPFILRGISLIGINAEMTDKQLRKQVWENIIKYKSNIIPTILFKEITMDEVKTNIENINLNKNVGRIIVNMLKS